MTLNDFIKEALYNIPWNTWVVVLSPYVFIGHNQNWRTL
jgi:hypothetical protein